MPATCHSHRALAARRGPARVRFGLGECVRLSQLVRTVAKAARIGPGCKSRRIEVQRDQGRTVLASTVLPCFQAQCFRAKSASAFCQFPICSRLPARQMRSIKMLVLAVQTPIRSIQKNQLRLCPITTSAPRRTLFWLQPRYRLLGVLWMRELFILM